MAPRIILLLIDPQLDFHDDPKHQGSLAVPGSFQDSKRIASMITQYKHMIEEVYVTMDSHHRNHIAHAVFWTNAEKGIPVPFQTITADEIEKETWFPRDPSLKDHCKYYSRQLEEKGRFKITVWPEHCLIGSEGHGVIDSIHESLMEWVSIKYKTITYVMKGMNCLTEMYSAIEAEVPIVSDPETQRNETLLKELTSADRLIIGGQALSHCVQYTVRDIVKELSKADKEKIYLLEDGSSPVQGFEESALTFLSDMKHEGLHVVKCNDAFAGFENIDFTSE